MDRLAALNGESRVFTCRICGKVRHVKDAAARVRRTADIVCVPCVMARVDKACELVADVQICNILGGAPGVTAERTLPKSVLSSILGVYKSDITVTLRPEIHKIDVDVVIKFPKKSEAVPCSNTRLQK